MCQLCFSWRVPGFLWYGINLNRASGSKGGSCLPLNEWVQPLDKHNVHNRSCEAKHEWSARTENQAWLPCLHSPWRAHCPGTKRMALRVAKLWGNKQTNRSLKFSTVELRIWSCARPSFPQKNHEKKTICNNVMAPSSTKRATDTSEPKSFSCYRRDFSWLLWPAEFKHSNQKEQLDLRILWTWLESQ